MEYLTSSEMFNSPLEAGIRSVGALAAAYPKTFDLERLIAFDHLVVHTGDVGGPASLHARLPHRSSEILVRRRLVEKGLLIMISRGLVERHASDKGIEYGAGELAETFLSSLTTHYLKELVDRGAWVISRFGEMTESDFKLEMIQVFEQWTEQFQHSQRSSGKQV